MDSGSPESSANNNNCEPTPIKENSENNIVKFNTLMLVWQVSFLLYKVHIN
jgi:hypothetical protein